LPNGPLVPDAKGNFYGTTYLGGDSGCSCGTIFKLTPDGTLKVLYTFTHGDGYFPLAGLLKGPDGYLYGTTQLGGAHDEGVVFKIKK